MNSQTIDYQLARMRYPPASNMAGAQLEDQVKKARMTRLDKSKVLYPYFLPVLEEGQKYTILLDGVLNSVNTRYTPASSSATLITGFISDFDTLKVGLSDILQSPKWQDFPVPARDIAGVSASLGGHHGYLDLAEPFTLEEGNQLSLDIVNTTAGNTRKWFVCAGIKVNPLRDVSIDVFDAADLKAIRAIEANTPQREVNLYLDVPFTGAANERLENLHTRQYNHPLLLWAISTTLKNCSVELWDSSDRRWMPTPVPIWAVAGLNSHASGRTMHILKRAVYIAANVELRSNLLNTFDPTLASDGTGSIVFHTLTP